jgi:hypothetical protein
MPVVPVTQEEEDQRWSEKWEQTFSENKQNIRTKSLVLVAEALNSIPSIAKKKDKKQNNNKNLRPLN